MKFKVIPVVALLISLGAFSTVSIAEEVEPAEALEAVVDKTKLPDAPKKLVDELQAECKNWAVEDAIPQKDANKYILNCINVELDIMGFKALAKLS